MDALYSVDMLQKNTSASNIWRVLSSPYMLGNWAFSTFIKILLANKAWRATTVNVMFPRCHTAQAWQQWCWLNISMGPKWFSPPNYEALVWQIVVSCTWCVQASNTNNQSYVNSSAPALARWQTGASQARGLSFLMVWKELQAALIKPFLVFHFVISIHSVRWHDCSKLVICL